MKIIGRMKTEAEKSPLLLAFTMLLLALACMFFPTDFLKKSMGEFGAGALVRFVFSIVGIVFMLLFAFSNYLKPTKSIVKNIDIILVALLVAVNNFPLPALAKGTAAINSTASNTALYVMFCFSIGLFEEVFFRGLILPLLILFFKNVYQGKLKKETSQNTNVRKTDLSEFWALFTSSVVFGLSHIVNLFSGADIGSTFLQIGYSTLIGAMCGAAVIFTKSVFSAILIHTVFDIGGLMLGYNIVTGEIWTTLAVVLTAVIGTLAGIYFVIRFIKRIKTNIIDVSEFETESKTETDYDASQSDSIEP